MTKNVWNKDEPNLLIRLYGSMPNKDLAKIIGRTKQALQYKAHDLGITLPKKATYKYCIDCGIKLSRAAIYNSRTKRCYPCSMKHHSGENHHNWNGGVAELRSLVHIAIKKFWIDRIMRRDNFTCQDCGKHGGDLEVHHSSIPYAEIRDRVISKNKHLDCSVFEDRKELAILIADEHEYIEGKTLCTECHYKRHHCERGELLETPNTSDEDNQQPSRGNVIDFVPWTVHRLMLEDSQTNKSNTSAPHAEPKQHDDIVRAYDESVRSRI